MSNHQKISDLNLKYRLKISDHLKSLQIHLEKPYYNSILINQRLFFRISFLIQKGITFHKGGII